jgi:5-methylcytosine-specific restriction endonuclease McrA
MHTLMLLPWMAPHKVISWQRAIVLSFLGKVEIVAEYDEIVRSPSVAMHAPAVVRMRRAHMPRHTTIRFARANVFRRDGWRCQYCGASLAANALTYDHVMPRARGGRTDWENIVTCCRPCNDKKRDRTPDEAGMKLLRRPVKPAPGSLPPARIGIHIDADTAPTPWRAFV